MCQGLCFEQLFLKGAATLFPYPRVLEQNIAGWLIKSLLWEREKHQLGQV